MRDDFSEEVKRTLAARVNNLCSNTDCRAQTTGPQDDPTKAISVGVAAHITAASPGGPRYNRALSPDQRRHADNGIWLCQNCAKLVDSDVLRFNETLLRAWKTIGEDRALNSIGKTAPEADRGIAPRLELFLECIGVRGHVSSPRTPARYFVLGLKNGEASGTAKFPGIRYKRSCGLIANIYGIDGNCGFGLPQSPSENDWEMFRGGTDHVIHPGETLKITQLLQSGRKVHPTERYLYPVIPAVSSRWAFDAVTFQCQISADGAATLTTERTFPEESIGWSM